MIIIQAVSIGVIVNNNSQGAQYTTASGPDGETGDGVVMLVSFNKSATSGAISKFLEANNGLVFNGPLAGGFFHIKFATKATKPENVEAIVKAMESRKDLFDFVSEFE